MLKIEETLKTLESLAKINLSDEEKSIAVEYFNFFTEKFDMLENIDTENTEPLITVSSLENVMREDISYEIISKEILLENAPEQNDGYFVVPRILD